MISLNDWFYVAVIFVFAVLAFQLWRLYKLKNKDRFKDPLNNFFLVLATFIGVALGILFANLQTDGEKKKKCVTAIQITSSNLRDFQHFLAKLLTKNDTGAFLRSNWRINRITPEFTVLDMPDAFTIMYARTYFDLSANRKNFANTMRFIDDHPDQPEKILRRKMMYLSELIDIMKRHLDWEDDFQSRKLTEDGIENKYHDEHITLYGHDYD